MNPHPTHHRLITGSLLATFALAALAPAAYAGHGWGQMKKFRRFDRPGFVEHVDCAPRRVVEYRSHDGGSTLGGFLGGLAVGAILTSAVQSHATCAPQPAYCPPPQPVYCPPPQPAYCPPPQPAYCPPQNDGYSYEDPYCRERFDSLDLYMSHVRHHGHHALVAQVIDDRDGDVVDVIRFTDGRWVSCERDDQGDWNDDRGDWNDDRGD